MNANITRLNKMTVKALREIAKLMGFKGYSKLRKAELVDMLAAQVVYAEFKARKENEAMKNAIIVPEMTAYVSLMDYPVPYGRPVTEAHVKICQTRGHVSYVKNGIDQGICPRCGEVTTSEEQVTAEEIDSEEKGMNANSAVIEIANAGINALTPILATAKATFENTRDRGTDADIEIAYQVYCDMTRAMEEFSRTIWYAQNPS